MTVYEYNKKGRVGGETDTAFLLKDDKKGSHQASLKSVPCRRQTFLLSSFVIFPGVMPHLNYTLL
jgi:hypothetical protein